MNDTAIVFNLFLVIVVLVDVNIVDFIFPLSINVTIFVFRGL